MDTSTQSRFASGFRGKGKHPTETEVEINIEAPGDKGDANPDLPADPGMTDPGPALDTPPGDEPGEPEMTHNEKTWKGRLDKREEELAAREAALAAAEAGKTTGSDPGMDPGSTPELDTAPAAADVMVSAPQEIKDIVQEMSDDFGADYVDKNIKLLTYLAQTISGQAAADAIGPLQEQNATLQGTLDSVIESFQSMHRGDIEEDEPDFEEVVNSPEFEQWVTSMEPDQQSRVVNTLQGGSASRIVRVLKQFKESLAASAEPEQGQVDTSALEAAAGVRSTGASTPNVGAASATGDDREAFKRGFYRGRA